jgi:hypothetical protein
VHAAVSERIAADVAFAARCREAARRGLALRQAYPPAPGSPEAFAELTRTLLEPLASELARRLG